MCKYICMYIRGSWIVQWLVTLTSTRETGICISGGATSPSSEGPYARPLMLSGLPQDMGEFNNDRIIPARTSPVSTRSVSGAREPGQLDEKWATGTRHTWTRTENTELLECYYTAIPERGDTCSECGTNGNQWILRNPQSRLTKKQLLAQCSNNQ